MKKNVICIIEPFCCTAVNNATCSSTIVAAQWVSCIRLFVTPWTAARQGFPVLQYLPEFAQTHVHWVGDAFNHLILCHSLLLLPSIFPSIRIFSNELALCIRWSQYRSFSFSISPSNEYLGLSFFRIDWFDLLAIQGTLESSPAQFESISSLVLNLLFGPTLTSIHDYWKNHSFDHMDYLSAKWCLCFLILCLGLS